MDAAIAAAAERIAAHRGPLVVVASALAGVTDLLLQSTPAAGETFARKHQQAARALLGRGKAVSRAVARRSISPPASIATSARRSMRSGISALRGQDALVARGERVSAQLLAAAVGAPQEARARTSMPSRSWRPTASMAARRRSSTTRQRRHARSDRAPAQGRRDRDRPRISSAERRTAASPRSDAADRT